MNQTSVTCRIMLVALTLVLLPASTGAQQKGKAASNMWTRSAQLYLEKARASRIPDEQKKLYQQAYDAASLSTQKDAANASGWMIAGQAALAMGNLGAADSLLDRAEQLYPDFVDEIGRDRFNTWAQMYNQGAAAITAGRMDEAIVKLKEADVIYQGRPSARLTLASIYQNKGDVENAIAMNKAALDILRGPARKGLKPEEEAQWRQQEEKATSNLATLLAFGNKNEDAAKLYEEVLARNPEDVRARMNLALVYSRAGKTAEATKIYTEAVNRSDLTDSDYFAVGVGLFQAGNYEMATTAFRKATASNPNFRDAHYNLAQTIFAQTKALEDAKPKATGEGLRDVNNRLVTLYEELGKVSEQVVALDPNSRSALLVAAQASRGLSDLTTDARLKGQHNTQTMALLQRAQEMPIAVDNVKTAQAEDGTHVVTGAVETVKAAAGTPVKLRFTLFGKGGAVLDTQEVSVNSPAVGAPASFELKSGAKGEVVGWKYEVVR